MSKMVKRFCTKYALTKGIEEQHGQLSASDSSYFYVGQGWRSIQYGPKDHYATRDEAAARAEQMRAAKIESLRKQIARLEARVF